MWMSYIRAWDVSCHFQVLYHVPCALQGAAYRLLIQVSETHHTLTCDPRAASVGLRVRGSSGDQTTHGCQGGSLACPPAVWVSAHDLSTTEFSVVSLWSFWGDGRSSLQSAHSRCWAHSRSLVCLSSPPRRSSWVTYFVDSVYHQSKGSHLGPRRTSLSPEGSCSLLCSVGIGWLICGCGVAIHSPFEQGQILNCSQLWCSFLSKKAFGQNYLKSYIVYSNLYCIVA